MNIFTKIGFRYVVRRHLKSASVALELFHTGTIRSQKKRLRMSIRLWYTSNFRLISFVMSCVISTNIDNVKKSFNAKITATIQPVNVDG